MKTCHYIAIGVGAVALIGGYLWMKNRKKSDTSTVTVTSDTTSTPPIKKSGVVKNQDEVTVSVASGSGKVSGTSTPRQQRV